MPEPNQPIDERTAALIELIECYRTRQKFGGGNTSELMAAVQRCGELEREIRERWPELCAVEIANA